MTSKTLFIACLGAFMLAGCSSLWDWGGGRRSGPSSSLVDYLYPGGEDGAFDMVRSLLRETESDLLHVFDRHREGDGPADELPVVMRFSLRGTPAEIQAMRAKLEDWLQDCTALCGDDASDAQEAWSGMLAFYRQPDEN